MGLLHASILSTFHEVEIVALCDKNKLINKFAKKIFNKTHIVNDLSSLSDFNLDLVYIVTPIPTHFRIVKTVYLEHIARNTFVEKTLASSFVEASELCQLVRKSNGVNMVGYHRRYSVTFNKALELLHQNFIGEPVSFKAYAYSSDFLSPGKRAIKASIRRGGLIRDLCAHAIDISLWYFGDLQVLSFKQKYMLNEALQDMVSFTVRGMNDLEGQIVASWCKEGYRMPEVGLSVRGSKGTLAVNDDKVEVRPNEGAPKTWYRHDLDDNVDFLLGGPEYYREDQNFIRCVVERSHSKPDFLTASKVEYIIDQAAKIAGKA